MKSMFSIDNPVIAALSKATDHILLSAMWVLLTLPVVTAGPATCALYYTVRRSIRLDGPDAWKCFWEAFRQNFKQAFVLGMLCWIPVVLWLVLMGFVSRFPWTAFLPAVVILLVWQAYAQAYLARFEMPTKMVLKNSALIMVANLPQSLLVAVVLALSAVICFFAPIALFAVPAVIARILEKLLDKVFRKYMSQEDMKIAEQEEQL